MKKIKLCDIFLALFLNKIALEVIDFHSALNFYGETTQTIRADKKTEVSNRLQHVISKRRFRSAF